MWIFIHKLQALCIAYINCLIQQPILSTPMQKLQSSSSHIKKNYNIDISQFPAQTIYFLVFPYSFDLKHKEEVAHIDPFLITFRNQSITFTEILDRYLNMNPTEKRNPKILTFSLPMGAIINKKMSVKNLKKQLRRDRVDGLHLFTIETPEQKEKKIENTEFENECGLMDFIGEESFDRGKQFHFHFLLPRSSYIITINISPSKKVSQLFKEFYQHLSKDYVQAVTANQFQDITEETIKQYILCDSTNFSKITNKQQITIHECKHFNDGDMIKVITHDKKYTFTKIIQSDFQITLIKKEDTPTLKSKILKIHYDQISNFTVSNLYRTYFLTGEEKAKFDIQTKQNRICLKVLEFILYPDDTFMKINKGIQKVKILGDFKLVAYFITEKMIFYQHMSKIGEKTEFSFDFLNIKQSPANQKIKNQCEYNSQKFCAERMKALQQLTIEKHFKTPTEVLPLVTYTSKLQIVNDQTKNDEQVYASLNKWLYTKNLLQLKMEELQHWSCKFASVLYRHLSKIKCQKKNLYRGVNYLLQANQKDRVTFKNFLSTSAQIKVALEFAVQGYLEKKSKNPNQPLVLYRITANSGKSIQHFSVYPGEREYLYEPYSEFRLMKKSLQQLTYQTEKYLFTVYDLQEIESPKLMPPTINNYILWVDDKLGEGTLIYNQLISLFHYPTVLFQLRSTHDLETWIKERSVIINDQTKKMIMITNMVRNEDGKPNYYAGVDAINVINQEVTPNIPIALYVGNLKSAEDNMKEKGCNCPNVKLMNTYDQLSQYVSQKIGVKFKRTNPENLEIIVSSNQSNDNNGEQDSFCEIM